jgi:uncharacterized protein (TIGR03437 family)
VTLLANGKVLAVGRTTAELYDGGQPTVTSVSAASFAADDTLAPESIAAAFGRNLATGIQTAPPSPLPLPTRLAGVSVRVRDSAGEERLAPLFFVSREQINFQVPRGTAVGTATVMVTSGDNIVAAGLAQIAGVAPGLFSANSTGRGVAAGFWIRVAEGGAQSRDYLFDLATHESVPVDLSAPADQVFLSIYGTGFRSGTSVTATVGAAGVPVFSFAAVTDYQGLDIVTIGPLPRTLSGSGEVDVAFSVDGKAANTVKVNIR